jgi:hypothetical protein
VAVEMQVVLAVMAAVEMVVGQLHQPLLLSLEQQTLAVAEVER